MTRQQGRARARELATVPERAKCRNCGRPVYKFYVYEDGRADWRHADRGHGAVASCRSASYSLATGWDETIPRKWQAAPLLEGQSMRISARHSK